MSTLTHKFSAVVLSLAFAALPFLSGCGNSNGEASDISSAEQSLTVANRTVALAVNSSDGVTAVDNGNGTSSKTYDMSNSCKQYENVRFLGRTYTSNYVMISDGSVLKGLTFFNWTASGFEIAFTGTELSVELVSNRYDQETVYFYAAVDGNEAPDSCNYIKVGGTEKQTYILASGLEDGNHIVTLRRASRCCMGSFFDERSLGGKTALVSATVKGSNPTLLGQVAERELQLEFIGDSITCGDAISLSDDGKQIEDGYRTYAAQTARKLNADYNVMSISGNGVICSVLGSPLLDLPEQYPYTDNLSNGDEKWDFSRYQPDYVIVNLATNDASGVKAGVQSGTYGSFSFEEFKYGTKRAFSANDSVQEHIGVWGFLNMIYENNPNAKIIWVYGAMGNSLAAPLSEAINEWNAALGTTTAYYLEIANDNTFENHLGQAHDGGHPSEYAGNIYSDQIVALIKSIEQS